MTTPAASPAPGQATPPTGAGPKAAALAAAAAVESEPTGLLEYRSEGALIIVGTNADVTLALAMTDPALRVRGLLTDHQDPEPPGIPFDVSPREEISLTGYLGAYEIKSRAGTRNADLVLDLCEQPLFSQALPPPGYQAPGSDETMRREACEEFAGLIGRFDKPQYFNYRADICAHGASELTGCTRCIDACPAQAIISIGNKVEVNPYLCQGGGACTTVCPTGAMTYRFPPAADTLTRVRRLLKAYHDAGGKRAALVLHGGGFAQESLGPDDLPLALEEVASVGVELWLAALAFGARAVLLVRDAGIPDGVMNALQEQRAVANAILEGLSLPAAVQWLGASRTAAMPDLPHATFGSSGGKREALFAAIDHLIEASPHVPPTITLPAGAPLGMVKVREGCTLCMACVSVCPAKALADGDGVPALRFFEMNCVQCGLCETACPENVISLAPRLLTDAGVRRNPAVLNEEEPFLCVRCSKPFATRSVVDRMLGKLAGHRMFQDEQARNRLRMCGDCRVIDMMQDDA